MDLFGVPVIYLQDNQTRMPTTSCVTSTQLRFLSTLLSKTVARPQTTFRQGTDSAKPLQLSWEVEEALDRDIKKSTILTDMRQALAPGKAGWLTPMFPWTCWAMTCSCCWFADCLKNGNLDVSGEILRGTGGYNAHPCVGLGAGHGVEIQQVVCDYPGGNNTTMWR